MKNDPAPSSSSGQEADWEAIARFVAGESDAHESAAVTSWLAAHPADAALVSAIQTRAGRLDARAEAVANVAVNVEGALGRVRSRIAAEEIVVSPKVPQLSVSRGGARSGRGASAAGASSSRLRLWQLAALASAAVFTFMVVRRPAVPSPAEAQVYATTVGARDSVLLSDGSRVILAPGSTLTVAAGFGTASREVTLEGAAFFEVAHDAAQPFTVRTRRAEIRDIGTAFSVKTDEAGAVAVAVTHGIVALRGLDNGSAPAVELRAGDRGVVAGADVAVARGTVTEDDVAWTHGQLEYRDTPMSEVQADVRRWYGLTLRLDGVELSKRTLTASFSADSASQVVRLIALALGAEAVQRGDTVVLQMTGRNSTP